MAQIIHTAPPNTGRPILGRTLPSILYQACEKYENPAMLNQPTDDGWTPLSLTDYRVHSEELAMGLRAMGLQPGDRVAFFLESDAYFCLADMACLIAGLVSVPIYLTHTDEAIEYVVNHSEAKAICVSTPEHLDRLWSLLKKLDTVQHLVLAQPDGTELAPLPEGKSLITFDALRAQGRNSGANIDAMLSTVQPDDLCTIIYTSGTTGVPKGVLLTQDNIASNVLTAFSGMPDYEAGPGKEVGISFLPMTHIFARTLHYGFVDNASSVYFTSPANLARDLARVRPTFFATVPRVLEKIYGRILEKAATLTGIKQKLLYWALDLAKQYDVSQPPSGLYALQLKIADALVFSKWREVLGGRAKYIISGGAALNARLTNLFGAAGIDILQGYGLTETSPVITFNRPGRNRAGTTGEVLPGVEVMIADDGEILTRGPHVMQGYYKEPEKTADAIDADGWFHTGDIGEFDGGFLRITDRKKDLFKLSTGKYVMPQPLENQLTTEHLVEQAVVVGSGFQFCTALIFPAEEPLRAFAESKGLPPDQPLDMMLRHPDILAAYQELVDRANQGMDPWSTIKRFKLIADHVTVDNGLLTPTLKIKRSKVQERFADTIDGLYGG